MSLGPVSATLLGEVRDLVRQRGLVVWLDPSGTFTRFVDGLDRDVAPVARYRGSFTRFLREAAPHAQDVTPVPLLLHLDGLDEHTVQRTPALELAAAGHRWSRDLKDLVTAAAAGRVPPDALKQFVTEVRSVEEADAWLTEKLEDGQGGLPALLRGMGLPEIVFQLLGKDGLAARVGHAADLADIWSHGHRRIGLPERWWKPLAPPDGHMTASDVAFAISSWALCVEYIHDPKPRTPKAGVLAGVETLPAAVVDACRKLAQALRERDADFYRRTADETEERIRDERAIDPWTLGNVDTFRFEEDLVLRAALMAMDPPADLDADVPWDRVIERAEGRAERSYWLRQEKTRTMAWGLVLDVARLGQALVAAGALDASLDLPEAINWYTSRGARVDLLHRVLEQDCFLLLKSELPEFDRLTAAVEEIRSLWAGWAADTARTFNVICEREGFLPDARLQQRTLFDEVVVPRLADGEVTAYFMVDAFRYEMAEALRGTFDGAGTTVELSARLAELPTVTEVGMNALAPVMVNGKLKPVIMESGFGGFQLGEYRVNNPATRKKAIHARAGGSQCPWLPLAEVLERDPGSLRRTIAQARVVVVHSQEIDTAGESGMGLTAFDPVLRQLREAWLRLREAGVRRFVITADHGFLLLRDAHELPHGTRNVPSRRHAVSPVQADHLNEVRLPLASLGYEGATDQLMMPDGIQVFRRFQAAQSFVHGGNSLQERVIPVLVVTSKAARGVHQESYEIRVAERIGIAGMHRVEVTLAPAGDGLFQARRELDVVLRVPLAPQVSVVVWSGNDKAEGQIRVPVGQPTELFFRLNGGTASKVAVEVACGPEVQAAPVSAGYFSVESTTAPTGSTPATGLQAWLGAIPDADYRQVLTHLAAHGHITEEEVARMVGSTSRARKFSGALDTLVPATAPIKVRVEMIGMTKRYVREEG